MIFNLGNEFDDLAFLLVLINFLIVPRLCWVMKRGLSTSHNEPENKCII